MRSVLPAAALVVLGLAAPAFADDCAAIVSASIKQSNTPYSGNMTITQAGGQPMQGKTVYMLTKLYTQVNGKWSVMPINSQQLAQQIQASMKNGSMSCKKAGQESVGGEAATIYTAHDAQQDGSSVDTKSWISNSRNLPLKSEAHINTNPGSQAISMTFNYSNVTAPAGVK
ncbi:MAG TPA: hypothetical protein VHW02_06535 [Rhizomicrobium sp.]|jgi:hypothetical protein|nr:hypothetical protein [Rhizomicrobium sp.]